MKALRNLRELCGIRQRTLSEESGISRSALTMFERGKVFPSRASLQALDDAFDRILDQRAILAVLKTRCHTTKDRKDLYRILNLAPGEIATIERLEREEQEATAAERPTNTAG